MQPDRFAGNTAGSRVRTIAITIAATVVAGWALGSLVGCTMVGDRLTGIGLNRAVPTTCIQQCNNHYRVLFDQERKRHLADDELCRSMPPTERSACFDEAASRHSVEMEHLSQGLTDCQTSCRESGG